MIVRDSARTLDACLSSIRPWVDEIVVVDTGSIDDSPEIARRYGARVSHFPWCDSFSLARNESLRLARGEWLFWMDSDDTIDEVNGRKLRDLAAQSFDDSVLGFVMQVHCPGAGDAAKDDVTVVDHVKVIRNHRGLSFENRIHEQVLPSIRRAGGTVVCTDIFVVHSGHDHSPNGQAKKHARDLRLLEMELADCPGHPFTLFNLGMTYTDMGEFDKSAEYLTRCIDRSEPSESHLRKAYALLVYDNRMLNRADEALRICELGLKLFPGDPELEFRSGLLLQELGRGREAVEAYRRTLRCSKPATFSSYDIGITGFKARHNLALALAEIGDHHQAELQWREIVRERPDNRAAWRGLGEVLIRQRMYNTALSLADHLDAHATMSGESYLLRASVLEKRNDIEGAILELRRATQCEPASQDAHGRLCRLLFERGELGETEIALKSLLQVDPRDAPAHHNLGTVYLRMDRPIDAIDCYRKSLDLRPESAETNLYLGYALEQAGDTVGAKSAWHKAISIVPGYKLALDAINRASQEGDIVAAKMVDGER